METVRPDKFCDSIMPDVAGGGILTIPYRRIFIIVVDVILFTLSFVLAYILRFESLSPEISDLFISLFPFVIIPQLLVFILFGLYKGPWRFSGIFDLVNIIRSGAFSLATTFLLLAFLQGGFERQCALPAR